MLLPRTMDTLVVVFFWNRVPDREYLYPCHSSKTNTAESVAPVTESIIPFTGPGL